MLKRVVPPHPEACHPAQASCEGCPFHGPKVGGKGVPDAKLVVVGESPGNEERRQGIPFAGSSGRVLHSIIPAEEALYVNAFQCVPPKGDKKAKMLAKATQACRGRAIREISEHPRRVILALGNAALWTLTGNYGLKITQERGKLLPSEFAELGVIPAIHPAAIMRGTGSYRQFTEDLRYALELSRGALPRAWEKAKFKVINTEADIKDALQKLSAAKELTGDIETSSLSPLTGKILSIGISRSGKMVYCFDGSAAPRLQNLIESPTIKWCWHNGKFDVKWFHHLGIKARVDDDTMLMSYALDENPGVHGLETVSSDILGAPDYKFMVQPYLPNKAASYELIPRDVLMDYMSIDVGNTAKLRTILRARVAENKHTERLYTKMLIPASAMLTEVEKRGMYVDLERVEENGTRLIAEMARVKEKIQRIAKCPVNPASPQQVADILYGKFKLPNRFKGATDKKALAKLPEVPIVKAILEYRKAAKQYGTYVKSIYKHIRDDGRIHPTYLIHGTVTGRLASREPNLQNIPRDAAIRGQFIASPGYIFLEVDLSQAELRSLAQLSGDPDLIRIYVEGLDLHGEVAQAMFGVAYDPEDSEQRMRAKNVNFGIIYGITPPGLSEQLSVNIDEAARYIDAWYKRFPVAAQFIAKCRAAPGKMQPMRTIFGRQKRIGLVTHENRKSLENEAANFFHQSIASDITLYSGIKLMPTLKARDCHIVNLIHDALLMEVPEDPEVINWAAVKTINQMQTTPLEWNLRRVPFIADAKVGKRWGSLEKYKPWHKEKAVA